MHMPHEEFSISDLSRAFGITTRTVRFYEERGLLSPKRSKGNQRVYSKRDRARLKLILRGKRFGLSLSEITDILGVQGAAEGEVPEVEQLRRAFVYGRRYAVNLEIRIRELQELRSEMQNHAERIVERLDELGEKLDSEMRAFRREAR